MASRNHHPEKLAGQKILLQRLQCEGGGDMEAPETIMNRHETEWLDLRRMDNIELMAQFPDKHFDLAIVDPPYGINAAKKYTGNGWVVRDSKDWDKCPPSQEYFRELYRVSRHQIIWGANYYPQNLVPSMGWVFWDKGQRDFSLADGELAFSSFNRALRVFTHSRGAGLAESNRIHPTQKPVALYRWLLANYAKPGQKILDTHLGSGSIAIACHYARLHLTACELDEDYFAASIARIKRETAQESFDFDAHDHTTT